MMRNSCTPVEPGTTAPNLIVRSFGYRHPGAADIFADATLVLDLREVLRDPHVDPAMRELTALDQVVIDHVLRTDGAAELLDQVTTMVATLLEMSKVRRGQPITVAFGCAGGRHRSAAFATLCALAMEKAGWTVQVDHVHIELPVIDR